jgi:hypothetical protein
MTWAKHDDPRGFQRPAIPRWPRVRGRDQSRDPCTPTDHCGRRVRFDSPAVAFRQMVAAPRQFGIFRTCRSRICPLRNALFVKRREGREHERGANMTEPNMCRRWWRTVFVASACLAVAGFWMVAPPAEAQQKTVKACQAEWRANKAIFEPKGITQQDYIDERRTFMTALPAAQATAGPAPARAAPAAVKPHTVAAVPAAGNQFSTEAQAKANCRSDNVVRTLAPRPISFRATRITETRRTAPTCVRRTRRDRVCARPRLKNTGP